MSARSARMSPWSSNTRYAGDTFEPGAWAMTLSYSIAGV